MGAPRRAETKTKLARPRLRRREKRRSGLLDSNPRGHDPAASTLPMRHRPPPHHGPGDSDWSASRELERNKVSAVEDPRCVPQAAQRNLRLLRCQLKHRLHRGEACFPWWTMAAHTPRCSACGGTFRPASLRRPTPGANGDAPESLAMPFARRLWTGVAQQGCARDVGQTWTRVAVKGGETYLLLFKETQ